MLLTEWHVTPFRVSRITSWLIVHPCSVNMEGECDGDQSHDGAISQSLRVVPVFNGFSRRG